MTINNNAKNMNEPTVSVSLAELLEIAEERGKNEARKAVEIVRILTDMCMSDKYFSRDEIMVILGIAEEPKPEAEKGAE